MQAWLAEERMTSEGVMHSEERTGCRSKLPLPALEAHTGLSLAEHTSHTR